MALTLAGLLLAAMAGLVDGALNTRFDTSSQIDATRDARFAMQRMASAVLGGERLLLPLSDNPATNWREHVREQTVPASPPEGDSTLATAVLAITLDPTLDINKDGVADGDNDGDGRVDEDPDDDMSADAAAGLVDIDDDGDGSVDEGSVNDDDEDGSVSEDPNNAIDDDSDGAINEDWGMMPDDDGDGSQNEDWLDSVAFYLSGSTLIERRPNLNPADGTDYTEFPIAENVTLFRIERIADGSRRSTLVDISLQVTQADGDPLSFSTRVRVGGGR